MFAFVCDLTRDCFHFVSVDLHHLSVVLSYHGLCFSSPDASTPDQVEEFVAESAIMLDFDHPNVIKLLAVCFNTEDKLPLIVLPYMANGDLKCFLQQKRHHCAKGVLPEVGQGEVVSEIHKIHSKMCVIALSSHC